MGKEQILSHLCLKIQTNTDDSELLLCASLNKSVTENQSKQYLTGTPERVDFNQVEINSGCCFRLPFSIKQQLNTLEV